MSLRGFLNALPPVLRRQKLLTALCSLKLTQPCQCVEFNDGSSAYVDLRDSESRAVYLSQSFWPEMAPLTAAFLRGGGDFFDVGANFGLVTFGVLPLVAGSGTRFHLFEANPRIIPCLNQSALLWPDESITINHCCVTNQPGTTRLSVPDASWGHGRMGKEGEEVPNLILDDYIERHRVQNIGFLKMDVEGWEVYALGGAKCSLASGKIKAAFIELVPEALNQAGTSADELTCLLQNCGFKLYFCATLNYRDPHGLKWTRVDVNGTPLQFARALPLPPSYTSGDVLAVHQSTPLAAELRAATD